MRNGSIRSCWGKAASPRRAVRAGGRGHLDGPAGAHEALEDRLLLTVTLQIDYGLDNSFFNTAQKKAAMQSVATELGSRLTDSLAALSTATYSITDPRTMSSHVSRSFSVAANTVRVFVAGAPLSGNTLGQGGPLFSESGPRASDSLGDFRPISGSIGFDNDGTTNWSFDGTPDATLGEVDFFAVARHEMLHVLGIGTAPTWDRKVFGGLFNGTNAKAANGGQFPTVTPDGGHFDGSVISIMRPSLSSISTPTKIDWATLQDIGWTLGTPDDTIAGVSGSLLDGGGSVIKTNQTIDSPTDVDLYRILVLRGTLIQASTSQWGTNTVDTYLRLFDANGNEIDSDDDSGTGAYSSLSFRAPKSGIYYLGVSSFNNTSYNPVTGANVSNSGSDPTGNYRIGVTLEDVQGDQGDHFDDAFVTGLSGSSGTFTTIGLLQDGFDHDLFKLTASAGATLSATTSFPLEGFFSADTYVAVFDSAGRKLIGRDTGGGGNYAALSYKFLTAGTYYVMVTTSREQDYDPAGGSIGGSPDLSGGDYKVTLTLGNAAIGGGLGFASAYPDIVSRTAGGQWWVADTGAAGIARTSLFGAFKESLGWRDVGVGDFNGDGHTDVIGRTSGGAWWVGVNNGNGGFANRLFATWTESAGWRDVRFGDFNGDGKSDVAGRTSAGQWWVGISNGTSFTTTRWLTWAESAGWHDVKVGDVNGDGKADLFGRTTGGQWWVARSTGGGFESKFFGGWTGNAGWHDVLVADFDSDGKADVAGRTSAGQWWVGFSTGSSFNTKFYGAWTESAGWRSVMVGDFTGDSRLDIIGRTSGGQWWSATNTGTAFNSVNLGTWAENFGWRDVMAADFTGNAKSDVLGRDANGRWWVGANTGTGMVFKLYGAWAESAGWRSTMAASGFFPAGSDTSFGHGVSPTAQTDVIPVSYGLNRLDSPAAMNRGPAALLGLSRSAPPAGGISGSAGASPQYAPTAKEDERSVLAAGEEDDDRDRGAEFSEAELEASTPTTEVLSDLFASAMDSLADALLTT